ncbi:Gfo/Idh/MocA family oxidoreductase [Microbacterium saccharophilum]|uniref:Gfo/Idh/MocA family oxidoreductase n=1 Tax=Microbacterium saccharophilum TaxID=1213358 RepID=A0A5C8I7J5_9MICO|nr:MULTISPECIES: Gfo/Idh/MocA family oxidoreductase [Microbacterium]TXK14309.1 Gfo/Idh/MocA family oxidoreductase [Microbacterium saccharophilum]GEP46890.1 oxidoreductase [Microbacterium saccharophilum]SFI22784.1 Predicted dehydrogenase [Microbacterium saccharophilum]
MTGLRWGILATGGIAHAFTSDLRTAGLDVAAVGSRSTASAQAFADEFGIPRAHGSYADLIADPEVDILYIATPHSHHLEPAVAALEAGKHVLIEKPVTLDADEAAAIRDVAAGRGLLAMEAMWTRYLPHMIRIRELVRSGALGEVRALAADHTQQISADPAHRLNALELGGGALLDLGIYPVSFAWDILGAPVEVRALGRLGETGADTEVSIALTHASGAVSSLLTSSRAAGPNTAHLIGTEARIEIDSVWYTPTSFRLIAPDGTVREEYRSEVDGRGMQYQALAAEQIIADGRTDSDLLTFEQSVLIMGTLDEVRAQVGVTYPKER